jgi:AcrR family transcriptional regulator
MAAPVRRRWVETGNREADALGDGRRAEIVEATWRLIATIGLDKTTMRRIADDVNCTTGLVTHYFVSKDDLLMAALEGVMARSDQRLRAARGQAAGMARLRAMILAALPLDEARLLEWRVWMAFWARAYSTPDLRTFQHSRYRRWRQAIRRAVQDARSSGDLPRSVSIEDEALHLVALILGLSVDTLISGAKPDPVAMVAAVDRHLAHLAIPPD